MDQTRDTSHSTQTLAALIAGCARRDQAALQAIYERYASLMLGIARRLTGRAEQARDIVQEAFIDLWRNAEAFDPALGSAEAWLLSLVRYRALNQNRANGRALRLANAVEVESGAAAGTTAALDRLGDDRLADAIALRDCLDRLAEDRRAMVVQAYLDGHTHDDLARAFARPLGTVKTQIRAALRALQECLG
ncbi:MAG: sigma-70 family RNA polymerase sigma factor [Azospirillaceae bacterium]